MAPNTGKMVCLACTGNDEYLENYLFDDESGECEYCDKTGVPVVMVGDF